MYVERLTKDMERLTQQIATYEAQASAQAEETQAAKEALSEVTTLWNKTVYTCKMKVSCATINSINICI